MIEKILPFLNRLIPSNLAFKGLSKINPRIGTFLTQATAAGYSVEESLDFLRNQTQGVSDQGLRPDEAAAATRVQQGKFLPNAVGAAAKAGLGVGGIAAIPSVIGSLFQEGEGQAQQQQTSAQPEQNIIAQYSPELARFIEGHLKSGRTAEQAGALAQLDPKFKKVIDKMIADSKMMWSEILAEIYGTSPQSQGQPAAQRQTQQSRNPQQPMQQAQQGQGQQNNANAQLMAMMQKFQQALGS